MERLHKVLPEVETDVDIVFENGTGDVLEENFSDLERFSEHDTESKENGDSRNEDVNNLLWLSPKDDVQRRKTKFRQNIRNRCHNIASRLPGTKGTVKDVANPVKSWELFINDKKIQIIVE
ncbi:hypothetical protein AVEN_138090-1 [Araneus ventricosus]|uniref:Uncharacterized protein n=1 Tax=Araneus ventricosus TaxID=182803 RepID=A0A4Y2SEQ8_ARAVE|nr:hypothetical protein AVEN_47566-1 [Araneus ventricosus]GBN86077.1 hypothetical protein AVEN_138090-1 [Araneus ventricosus]